MYKVCDFKTGWGIFKTNKRKSVSFRKVTFEKSSPGPKTFMHTAQSKNPEKNKKIPSTIANSKIQIIVHMNNSMHKKFNSVKFMGEKKLHKFC